MKFKTIKFGYLLIPLLALIAFFVWKNHFHRIYIYDKTVATIDQTYDMIDQMVRMGKTKVKYTSLIDPGPLQFDKVMKKAEGEDIYTYCELYGYEYQYVPSYNGYEVSLELKTPIKDYNKKMEKRVNQIADCYRDLGSDYEKVKAVHDYICENATYDFTYGGAYSNLYRGRSTCTGYAYSFYAIMKALDIPVTLEYNTNHVWNRVMVEGKWYNMDVTWDGQDSTTRYDYFLKCDRDWAGHDHGGSDAEKSLPVTGESARTYYKMVPNYRLQKNIMLYGGAILLFVISVCALMFMNKGREKEKKDFAMKFGDWVFYHPSMERGVHKVILQWNKKLQRRESWEIENGKFFHVVKEKGSSDRRMEVSKNDFISQLELVINAARSNRFEGYMREMMQFRDSLR